MAYKQIAGTVEITTGVFTPTVAMPLYQGESGKTQLEITIYNNGVAYSKPVGASLRMYFYYEVANEMTLSLLMTVTGNIATCEFNDVLTALAARPKLVVRELDAENITVFCAFYLPVPAMLADTVVAVSPVTMDLLRPPYINTSDGHWYEWDTGSETYVDSGVAAAGDGNYVAFISQTLTDAQKLQARNNIGAMAATSSDSAIKKGDGAGGLANATKGTDYLHPDNIGDTVAAPAVYATATLLSAGWAGSGPYTQTVTATGVKAGDKPIVDLVRNATDATAELEIASFKYCLFGKFEVLADNQLKVTCYADQPTIDLNLSLVVPQ